MTRTGRAVIAHGKDFSIREYPVPDPQPGALLLHQELAGICGTDLHNWQKGFTEAVQLGHENVGIIDALGKGVTHDYVGNPVREGDRVIFAPRTSSYAYGFHPDRDDVPHLTGGFGDYIHLHDPETCFLKTTAPPEVAVLIEPFAIAVHAVMRGNVQLGDTVIVQGSGAIGLLTAIAARLSGAARIIVIGGPPERLALAQELGVDATVDIAEFSDVEARKAHVRAQTPRSEGADVVFECAGFLPAVPEGLEYVKQDGTFVEVGHFVDTGTVTLNPHRHLLRSNLRLEGIWGGRYPHFVRGLPLLERGDFPFAKLVSHVLPLEEVQAGFNALNGTYQLNGETVVKIALKGSA